LQGGALQQVLLLAWPEAARAAALRAVTRAARTAAAAAATAAATVPACAGACCSGTRVCGRRGRVPRRRRLRSIAR
jgi:hypothetical protein